MGGAVSLSHDFYSAAHAGADDLKTAHSIANGAVSAVKNADKVLAKVAEYAPNLAAKVEAVGPALAKIAPYVQKVAPFVEKAAIPIAVIAGGAKATAEFAHGHDREGSQTVGQTGGVIAGGLAGAEIGAAIGSVVPGVGTAVGGAVGGIVGGFAGSAAGKYVGGWIHDRVVDVKTAFTNAATGATVTQQMVAQNNLQASINQNTTIAPPTAPGR